MNLHSQKNLRLRIWARVGRKKREKSKEYDYQKWHGLPWWSNGEDSVLPIQGARVQLLGRELDPEFLN